MQFLSLSEQLTRISQCLFLISIVNRKQLDVNFFLGIIKNQKTIHTIAFSSMDLELKGFFAGLLLHPVLEIVVKEFLNQLLFHSI